jgi:hypothetical protein
VDSIDVNTKYILYNDGMPSPLISDGGDIPQKRKVKEKSKDIPVTGRGDL